MDNELAKKALLKLGSDLATTKVNQAIMEAQIETQDEQIKQLKAEIEQLKNNNKKGGNH